MRFRIMDSRFFVLCDEATRWLALNYLEPHGDHAQDQT